MRSDSPNASPPGARQSETGRSPALSASPFRSRIESVGLCLPEGRLSSEALVRSCRHPIDLDLERLTGIRERRVCSEDEDSYSLARGAARDCLSRSRHEASKLEMVISCSITKFRGRLSYVFEPALSLFLKQELGAPAALNFDLSNACAGMLTGVMILDDFIRRGVVRCGMVVSGECIMSLATNAARTIQSFGSDQLASLTVGDAGAAVVLERAENGALGITACELVTLAEYSDLCIGKGCPDAPGAAMYTDAKELHHVAITSGAPTAQRAFEQSGTSWGELDWVIPHQSSVRAIRTGAGYWAEALGGRPRHIVENLEERGNTSSTTHFVALHRCLDERRIAPGERVALLAFASGIVVGAVVFTMDGLGEQHVRAH